MSMLAGPKRRKQYVLNPRGKPLYNDDDRFGSKMLQKMGWSKGKGLGAKESGSIDFVRVNFKCDAAGLGFEERDDQWTEHEKGFNGFLESLNGENVNGKNDSSADNSSDDEISGTIGFGFKKTETESKTKAKKLTENISGQSLEERSKQSKARVHYKKFTKGKDLAQYSEKDLANIFGKKVNNVIDINEKSNSSVENEMTQSNCTAEEPIESQVNEDSAMLKTSSTSIDDYFKKKMLEKKASKLKNSNIQSIVNFEDKPENVEHSAMVATEKVKSKKRKSKHCDVEREAAGDNENSVSIVAETSEPEQTQLPVDTVIKKKKRQQNYKSESLDNTSGENNVSDVAELIADDSQNTKIKKKKKKQKVSIEESKAAEIEGSKTISVDVVENKEVIKETLPTPDIVETTNSDGSKKKKRKRKNTNLNTTTELDATSKTEENVKFTKSKAKPDAKTLSNMKDFHKFYDAYQISTFVAEKFRHLDFSKFKNSNLAEIIGYSHDENIKIEIISNPLDEFRILDLWKRSFDKYSDRKLIKEQAKQAKNTEEIAIVAAKSNASGGAKNVNKRKGKKGLNNLKRLKRRSVFKLGI